MPLDPRSAKRAALISSLLFAAACGGDSQKSVTTPPAAPPEFPRVGQRAVSGEISAGVDGQAWKANSLVAFTMDTNDRFVINGVSDTTNYQLILVVHPVFGSQAFAAPQTFGQFNAGLGRVWSTSAGGTGSVTIDTATIYRVAGHFEFTASATLAGTTPTTKTVVSGRFGARFVP
jgi:hypothetical protein